MNNGWHNLSAVATGLNRSLAPFVQKQKTREQTEEANRMRVQGLLAEAQNDPDVMEHLMVNFDYLPDKEGFLVPPNLKKHTDVRYLARVEGQIKSSVGAVGALRLRDANIENMDYGVGGASPAVEAYMKRYGDTSAGTVEAEQSRWTGITGRLSKIAKTQAIDAQLNTFAAAAELNPGEHPHFFDEEGHLKPAAELGVYDGDGLARMVKLISGEGNDAQEIIGMIGGYFTDATPKRYRERLGIQPGESALNFVSRNGLTTPKETKAYIESALQGVDIKGGKGDGTPVAPSIQSEAVMAGYDAIYDKFKSMAATGRPTEVRRGINRATVAIDLLIDNNDLPTATATRLQQFVLTDYIDMAFAGTIINQGLTRNDETGAIERMISMPGQAPQYIPASYVEREGVANAQRQIIAEVTEGMTEMQAKRYREIAGRSDPTTDMNMVTRQVNKMFEGTPSREELQHAHKHIQLVLDYAGWGITLPKKGVDNKQAKKDYMELLTGPMYGLSEVAVQSFLDSAPTK